MILKQTLDLAGKFNFKLNIDKCEFFLTRVKFCGRIFTPQGITHDSVRIQALNDLKSLKKAIELQQLLMASQWMARSIPNYNNIVVQLQDIFEKAMKS